MCFRNCDVNRDSENNASRYDRYVYTTLTNLQTKFMYQL